MTYTFVMMCCLLYPFTDNACPPLHKYNLSLFHREGSGKVQGKLRESANVCLSVCLSVYVQVEILARMKAPVGSEGSGKLQGRFRKGSGNVLESF